MSATAAILGAGFLNSAGSLFSNIMNQANQRAINQENVGMQYAINADQIEAARLNNETAVNLANTAHQREVQDLRDAGLNPILSANGSGASVPSLDTPGLDAVTRSAVSMDNPLSGIASALQQAIQVQDNHDLAEARLAAAGWKGNATDKRDLMHALAGNAILEADTAAQEAHARDMRAQASLEASKLEELFNRVKTREFSNIIQSPQGVDLVREGIISDLKLKANENFRRGISSAGDVASGLSNVLPITKGAHLLKRLFK